MYSTYFVNNKTYGADDINTVLARLTTQGVSLFNGNNDTLIDINTAISNLVSDGVQVYETDGCKVIAATNGKYKISKGCCWMPSGACIIFDDDGYVFTPNFKTVSGSTASTCYIYLRQGGDTSDEASNDINIIISGTAPQTDDVALANISSVGLITDKRKVAEAKITVAEWQPEITLTPGFGSFTVNSATGKYERVVSYDAKKTAYKYVYDMAGISEVDSDRFYLCELTDEYKEVSERTISTQNTANPAGQTCHITLKAKKIGTVIYMIAISDKYVYGTVTFNLKVLMGVIS